MMKRPAVAAGFMVWMLLNLSGPEYLSLGGGMALQAQQPQQQEEFVPIDELPPQDQLPAAPLLIAAYAFVALALLAYVVSVARRLGGVQRDLDRLESDLKRHGRT